MIGHWSWIKQVYRRRYESRRSPKPKLHQENLKKYGEERFWISRLEFFLLRFWSNRSNLRAILNQFTKFRPNQATRSGVTTSYTISKWRPRRLHTTFGFVFNVVTLFRSSKFIYRPNFIDISQFTASWDITTSGLEKQTSVIYSY